MKITVDTTVTVEYDDGARLQFEPTQWTDDVQGEGTPSTVLSERVKTAMRAHADKLVKRIAALEEDDT